MQTSTLVVVSVATALNVGLWFWSKPSAGLADRPSVSAATCQTNAGSQASANSIATKLATQAHLKPAMRTQAIMASQTPAQIAESPAWIPRVRDDVLELAQSTQFSDKLAISGIECQSSSCKIDGATHPSADGTRNSSSEVARLMKAMNDGQIAGGDTGRWASLNSIQSTADGVQFVMSIEPVAAPPVNPCQSVFDLWNKMHPGEWDTDLAKPQGVELPRVIRQ